jgi:hypothetical protein
MSPWRRLGAIPAEQLDHPAGTGADVEKPADRAAVECPLDRLLDFGLCNMQRANRVPHVGVGGKIAARRFRPVGSNALEARCIGREQQARGLVHPAVEQSEHRRAALRVGQGQEHPAAFLAAFHPACVGEDLEVPGDPRLALPENLRKFADGQFHHPQKREDAEPRRVGKCLKQIGERHSGGHGITI